MRLILQKFGGTSLNSDKLRARAARFVQQKINDNFQPIVVVSAIGREDEPYSTDTLLKIALTEFPTLENREKDLLLSCGEIISAVIMTQTLRRFGIDAIALNGTQAGILTSSEFGSAKVKKIYPEKILKLLQKKKVPIIAGFQGISEESEITTLGRGGSDTTACALAAALQAESIEIFSDVEGLQTADPKIISNTDLIENCDYTELVELANKGAKIVHPRAVEIAENAKIPVLLRSISTGKIGSIIHTVKHDKPVTGITSKKNVFHVLIRKSTSGKEMNIFRFLAEEGISVDLIDIREKEISFIIEKEWQKKTENILSKKKFQFLFRNDFVKISVVGKGMTGQPGIMAQIVQSLQKEKIDLFECTDSHTTISCLIPKEKEKIALATLHKTFIEENK